MLRETEKVIRDILINEMSLNKDTAFIASQNFIIPSTNGLFVSIGMVDSQVYGNNNRLIDTDNEEAESQTVVLRENIQIDIMSENTEARLRRWEVIAAFASFFAIKQQELYSCKIGKIPSSFVNSTIAEGGSAINRYTIIIPVLVWYNKTKSVEWFSSFEVRADTEKTIEDDTGLIEFEIPTT